MREIKFRGIRKDNGKWMHGCLLQSNNSTMIGMELVEGFENDSWLTQVVEQVLPETVGEYSGILDKKGVEIYEGDKVMVHEDITYEVSFGKYFIDDIMNFGWYLGSAYGNKSLDYSVGNVNKNTPYEIIGNIHGPKGE